MEQAAGDRRNATEDKEAESQKCLKVVSFTVYDSQFMHFGYWKHGKMVLILYFAAMSVQFFVRMFFCINTINTPSDDCGAALLTYTSDCDKIKVCILYNE